MEAKKISRSSQTEGYQEEICLSKSEEFLKPLLAGVHRHDEKKADSCWGKKKRQDEEQKKEIKAAALLRTVCEKKWEQALQTGHGKTSGRLHTRREGRSGGQGTTQPYSIGITDSFEKRQGAHLG